MTFQLRNAAQTFLLCLHRWYINIIYVTGGSSESSMATISTPDGLCRSRYFRELYVENTQSYIPWIQNTQGWNSTSWYKIPKNGNHFLYRQPTPNFNVSWLTLVTVHSTHRRISCLTTLYSKDPTSLETNTLDPADLRKFWNFENWPTLFQML